MSRTTFSLKFKETVGVSPMDYLTRWRMRLASDRLENSSDPISVIARSFGFRIRKRLQHSIQEGHGLFATAIRRWPESVFHFTWRGRRRPRR
jgi:transcriptional regulator GlxA family with amidase domain